MHTIRPMIWSDPALWRIVLLLAGLLLPPILGLVSAVRGWKQARQSPRERKVFSSVILETAVLINWSLFALYLFTEQIGGLNIKYHIGRFTGAFLIVSLSLVVLSIRASSFRLGVLVANLLVLVMWFSIAYAPQHWLERFDFEGVRVDDRPVPATMYIGNPRQSEAEAIAVVHVPDVGDYFLDFSGETFREASRHELVALSFGAWTWRKMSEGRFTSPLPFRNVNEYRIPVIKRARANRSVLKPRGWRNIAISLIDSDSWCKRLFTPIDVCVLQGGRSFLHPRRT